MHIVPFFFKAWDWRPFYFIFLMGDGIIAMGSFRSRVSPYEGIGDWRLARISLPITMNTAHHDGYLPRGVAY